MKKFWVSVLVWVLVPASAAIGQSKGKGYGAGNGVAKGLGKTPPALVITAPSDGATVSNFVTISAEATDEEEVFSVTFSIDGGPAIAMTNTSGSTWEGVWDSTAVADGGHAISVTAKNIRGNASGVSISVTTDNIFYPDAMAAIGDSITRAVFADGTLDGLAEGQPQHSWATGYEAGDGVNSHYERILAQNGDIAGKNFNNAVSGARIDDFVTQANATIPMAPDYVTVFLGHNDLCVDTVAQIPSNAVFEAYVRAGLDTLIAGLPDAQIVVLELVDVAQLYDCCSDDWGCQFAWWLYSVCQSVTNSSSGDRAIVRQRTIEFNNILRNVSAEKGVLFEDDIFEQVFSRSDVNSSDCFHPSLAGHSKIAEGSYDESRF